MSDDWEVVREIPDALTNTISILGSLGGLGTDHIKGVVVRNTETGQTGTVWTNDRDTVGEKIANGEIDIDEE